MKRAVVLCAFSFLASCGPQQGSSNHRPDMAGGGVGGNSCTAPPADTDHDGISDADEGGLLKPPRDTDGDGIPDYKDLDSDNDGIPDAVEGRNGNPCTPPVDSDGDGKPDYIDLDSDDATNSTVGDREEAGPDPMHPIDTNGDGNPDYMDPDNDGDHIYDKVELTPTGSPVAATKLIDAPDTNSNGVPDFRDLDSDGDTIYDSYEGSADTNGDGVPNFRDLDSDGDCIPDALEGGVTTPGGKPRDFDGDGFPDFEDTDSDNDGLLDKLEDKNCNGVLDACEFDRLNPDTNGDGITDLVSWADCNAKTPAVQAQTMCMCGTSMSSNPLTHGDFVFVVDYNKPPAPTVETLNLSTDVSEADVIFSIDTTGSMGGAINNLKTNLASMAAKLQTKIKSVALGVVEHKDFGDPFVVQYDWRITTVNTAAGLSGVQGALNTLSASGGGDSPEAGWEALYSVAGGPAISVAGYNSTFNLAATNPTVPPAGEVQGNVGGAGFRAGSVPIVVTVSDAEWHDAPGSLVGGDPESGLNMYGTAQNGVPSRRTAITRAQMLNAHVMGLAGTGGGASGNPKARMLATAKETGAVVSPADFGAVGVRPAGCAITDCCTGLNGVGEPSIGGTCPLSFYYDDSNGNGTSDSVVSGIVALANGLKFDIHVQAADVDPMTVVRFMDKLVPNLSGAGPAAMCISVIPTPLQDNFTGPQAGAGPDGVLDTFPGITGGLQICFDVVPKMNTSVMQTNQPQLFHALLQVKGVAGGATVNLGTPRDVFFLVPPHIDNGPIQ
jgi:hypothetical protein